MLLPRAGYMAGISANKLVVAGGSYWKDGQKIWTSQVDIFDPKKNHWQQSTSMPMPRSDAASVCIGNALYLFGGGSHKEVRSDGWVFKSGSWTALKSASLPQGRLYSAAAVHQGKIYISGGLSKVGDYSTVTNTFWVWNSMMPQRGWKKLPPIPGLGRINHAVAKVGAKIYVFGGATSDGANDVANLADVYCFDTRTQAWSQQPDLPIARRAWWAVTLGRSIFLFGGCTTTFEREIFEYQPSSGEFRTVGLLPHGVADAKFFRTRNLVVTAGGEAGDKIRAHWTMQAEVPAARTSSRS
jgi:N-acetylneuraminic acid mutarotase